MGFSLKSLDPVRTLKKNLSSQKNLIKNPFDKDAHRAAFASNVDAAAPILANQKYAHAKEAEAEANMLAAEQAKLDEGFNLNNLIQQFMTAKNAFQAPPSHPSFSQLFNQSGTPQADYSQVTDVYQRGGMPNNILARYNHMNQMLQQQQAAMVPRTQPQGQAPFVSRPNPYTNFAQLFGGRNG